MSYQQKPIYRIIKNHLYRKLLGDEVKYYINEVNRLIIKDNAFWLDLSDSNPEFVESLIRKGEII